MLLVQINISGSIHEPEMMLWWKNVYFSSSPFSCLLWEILMLILVKDLLTLHAGANAAAQRIFGHTEGVCDWIQELAAAGIFGDFSYCRLIWHKL